MEIFKKMAKEGLKRTEIRADKLPFPEAGWLVDIMKKEGHEKVCLICYPELKLRAAIAIHSRAISKQTLGGIRMFPYSNEKEAIIDVLRLSKGMTYKSVMAGVQKGGAKCVVWEDPKEKSKALLEKLAEEIDFLQGEYIGGEDMNISEQDVLLMKEKTFFVAGLPETYLKGKYRGSGNPSPITAKGVLCGIQACLRFLQMGSLKDKIVAVSGIGQVGRSLVNFLHQEGVKQIIVTDINSDRVAELQKEFGNLIKAVDTDEIFSEQCHVFAPCARGGILNKETIPLLRCRIVAGAANNQLQESSDGKLLMDKGILYAPDYVVNAGGVINVDDELHPEGYSKERVTEKLKNISNNLLRVFWYSERLNMPTNLVSDMLAEEKIYLARKGS